MDGRESTERKEKATEQKKKDLKSAAFISFISECADSIDPFSLTLSNAFHPFGLIRFDLI